MYGIIKSITFCNHIGKVSFKLVSNVGEAASTTSGEIGEFSENIILRFIIKYRIENMQYIL